MEARFIEMEIREIQTSDDPRELPVIVLAEKNGRREFPIFVGHIEAKALEDAALDPGESGPLQFKRPLTHDLIYNVIDGLNARLSRVLITRLEHSTFFATLIIDAADGKPAEVDTRPSDAMVLATKRKIPIYVEENVLAEVERGNLDKP